MTIEEIRKNFISGGKTFCDVCRSEVTVRGDRKTGIIQAAYCAKDANHYSAFSNLGSRISDIFSDVPRKKKG